MPLSSAEQEEWNRILQIGKAPPPAPPGFGTQFARGAVSGATFGMVRPYADAGPGGFPETLGNIAGSALMYAPLARVVGAGVAGLGALGAGRALAPATVTRIAALPMAERAGALKDAGLAAAGKMLTPGGRAIGTELSPWGQIFTHAAAGGLAGGLPEALGTEHRTGTEIALNTALGAGLGGLVGKLGARHGSSAIAPDVAETAATASRELFGTNSGVERFQTMIAAAQRKILDFKTEQSMATSKSDKAAYGRLIKSYEDQVGKYNNEITRLSASPPGAPMTTPADVRVPEIQYTGEWNSQPRMDLRGGFPAGDEVQPGLGDALAQIKPPSPPPIVPPSVPEALPGTVPLAGNKGALRVGGGAATPPLSHEPIGFGEPFAPRAEPPRSTEFRPGGTTAPFSFPGDGINLSASHDAALSDPVAIRRKMSTVMGMDSGIQDAVQARSGVDSIRRGMGYVLPPDTSLQAKILDDIPFGDYTLGCFYGSWCDKLGLHLLMPGFRPKGAAEWVGRKLLTPRWMLTGTEVEKLPQSLAQVEGRMTEIRDQLYKAIGPIMGWSPATKRKVQELFYTHMRSEPEVFYNAVRTEIPEVVDTLPILRDVLENIRMDYIQSGALRPEQFWMNYFPVVRERKVATSQGLELIERGDGYMPRTIQNLISPRNPVFAKTRTLTNAEDMPHNISFDDTLRLYFSQYSRHRALQEAKPELDALLQKTPDDLKKYTADLVNFWMGDERLSGEMSDVGRYMRQFNFMRTIGASVLAPLVNTMQRLNTMAVVSPSSFLQAFRDVKDPERLALMGKAGLSNLLGKFDVPEEVVGGGMLSPYAAKLQDLAGRLFSYSESQNKKHAFMAGLREAEKNGLEGPKAIEFAKEVMWDTQFNQTRSNIPEAFRGEFGRTIGQFQTYRINQTHFLARLVDTAASGVASGDIHKLAPLIKFMTAATALGGGGAVMFGDWGEEKLTRAALGKASHISGFPELLGVSMASQMGLGSINADDVSGLLYFLPGPTATYVQGLLGTLTGVSFGHGADMTQVNRDLTFDERVRFVEQSLPIGGLQMSRIINALRLVQNDGQFRRALDVSDAIGLKPSAGELLSSHAASAIEVLGAAAGLPSAAHLQDLRKLTRQRDIMTDKQKAIQQASEYWAAGDAGQAAKIINRYNRKYSGEGAEWLSPTPPEASLRNAFQRRFVPPGFRVKPPGDLIGAEAFE